MLITILECSVSMSVLILLLLALTPWLSRRYAAKWLYYTWLVIVFGLIIPFRFHPAAPLIEVPVVSSSLQRVIAGIPENLAGLPVTAGTPFHHQASVLSMSRLLFLLWAVGSVFFLLRNIWKHHCFLKAVQRWGEEVKDPEILDLFSRIKEKMGIREEVKLLICPWITSPMMTGFFHPVILLPQKELPSRECALVLQHELVHRKRKDLWYKCLVFLATALHWFNPLVYLMGREIDTWCEISCDAEVVKGKNLEERQCYGVTILRVAGRRASFPTVLSTSFTGGKRTLRNRLRFILEGTARKRTGILLLCLVLLGTLGTGIMTTHTTVAGAASDPWGKGEILNYIFFPDREMGLDPKEVQNYYAWKLATTGTTDEAQLQKDLNLTDQQMTQLRQLGMEECSHIQHLTLPSGWTSSSVSASINASFATIDNNTRAVLGSQYDAFRQWVQNWEQREEQYQKQWFEEQVRLINTEGGP
ncbi:MAG: M56 family metallopeptidase, partial [Candidatus Cryosericum sp.]